MEVGSLNACTKINVDLMIYSLDIYSHGRADASSALGPVARSLVTAEKIQDEQ
jgi:hypothetical protein